MTWYFPAIGGFILASIIAWTAHSLDVERLENDYKKDLAAQISADDKACKDAKQTTTNSEQKYEELYRVAMLELERLHSLPTTCVPVAKPTSKCNAGNVTNQPDKPNGITSTALYDFAGQCEIDRIKTITLQKFINDTWKLNQQKD